MGALKKAATASYILLTAVLLAISAYMYFSADARFTVSYNTYGFLVLTLMGIIALARFKSQPVLIAITVAVLAGFFTLNATVFMGSLEKFVYAKNKALYQETAMEIADAGTGGYIFLSGSKRRLYREVAEATRNGGIINIYFHIDSSLGIRSRIIYTTNIDALLKEESARTAKLEVIDSNWCIAFP